MEEIWCTRSFVYWQVKAIFDFLKHGFQEIGSSLDLSFEDDSVADEKIPFLAYLASRLKNNSDFPYEPPAGSKHFRNLIAGFLKTKWKQNKEHTLQCFPATWWSSWRNQCYQWVLKNEYSKYTRESHEVLHSFQILPRKILIWVTGI